MNSIQQMKLDYGNCGAARPRGKEAYVKDASPRTETRYKADGTDELAQHSKVPSSLPEVNRGVVHRNNALLPGEASRGCSAGCNLPSRHCRVSSHARVDRR